MALDTYANLQTTVGTWLHRTDLTAQIPDFISLAEAQFQRTIRNRNMEQRATATSTQYMALPSDYIEMRRLQLADSSGNRELQLLQPGEINRVYSSGSAEPVGYAIIANQIQLAPSPNGSYTVEIDYYKKIPALSSTNTTNWLLTAYPDLYLVGSLLAAAVHIQDGPRVPMWTQTYAGLMNDVNAVDSKSRFSGAAPYMRAA